MSMRPHASRVLATRFSSCALSEMRAVTAIASPPLARIAFTTSSHGPRLRAEITTRPPASAEILTASNSVVKTCSIRLRRAVYGEIRKLNGRKRSLMNTELTTKNLDIRPVTKIIASYVGNHTLSPEQLPALIISVQQALRDLGKPPPTPVPRTPAVPIRRSVQHDHVVCLECGFRGKTLRRHLGTRHGLQTAEYLRRWDLASDHPLTAPAYSEQRSTMA